MIIYAQMMVRGFYDEKFGLEDLKSLLIHSTYSWGI